MAGEIQQREHSYYGCNGKGGAGCAFCKISSRSLRFLCAPFRAVYAIPWSTWKDAMIMFSGIALVMIITIYTMRINESSSTGELPEVLKFLLSGVVGYIFAYVPSSKAMTSAERDRSAALSSDAVLQQANTLLLQQKEIYESRIERLMQYIEDIEQEEEADDDEKNDQGTAKS